MASQIVLLRGINLGAVNRISMPQMRDALAAGGFTGPDGGPVRTYLQSGNIAVESALDPDALAWAVEGLVVQSFDVVAPAVARTEEQLHRLIDLNPFPEPAEQGPKAYQVSFLSEEIGVAGRRLIDERARIGDTVAVSASGHEVYAWHPGGIHTSKLAAQLTERRLGVRVATARNWTTVLACRDLLDTTD